MKSSGSSHEFDPRRDDANAQLTALCRHLGDLQHVPRLALLFVPRCAHLRTL